MIRDGIGQIFVLVGWSLALWALFSSAASPGSEMVNFGLLVDKIVSAIIGCSMAVSGTMMLLAPRKRD